MRVVLQESVHLQAVHNSISYTCTTTSFGHHYTVTQSRERKSSRLVANKRKKKSSLHKLKTETVAAAAAIMNKPPRGKCYSMRSRIADLHTKNGSEFVWSSLTL